MKKIALLSLFCCFTAVISLGQSNWIRIDKYVPYSNNVKIEITIGEDCVIDTIGGDAELFWTWSGNKATCTATKEGFKQFIKRQNGAVPRLGIDAGVLGGGTRTYVIYLTYDPAFLN